MTPAATTETETMARTRVTEKHNDSPRNPTRRTVVMGKAWLTWAAALAAEIGSPTGPNQHPSSIPVPWFVD